MRIGQRVKNIAGADLVVKQITDYVCPETEKIYRIALVKGSGNYFGGYWVYDGGKFNGIYVGLEEEPSYEYNIVVEQEDYCLED